MHQFNLSIRLAISGNLNIQLRNNIQAFLQLHQYYENYVNLSLARHDAMKFDLHSSFVLHVM